MLALFITAQVFGTCYFIFDVFASRAKERKKIYKFNELSNIASFLQYICLGAWSGAICTSIALVRNRVFIRFKSIPLYVFLLYSIITIMVNVFFVTKPLDILPIIGILIIAFGLFQKNVLVTKYCWLIVSITCLIYDIYSGAYVSAVGESVSAISSLITIIELNRKR